jgi:hypothetical protein
MLMKIRRTAQRPPSKTINEGAESYRKDRPLLPILPAGSCLFRPKNG